MEMLNQVDKLTLLSYLLESSDQADPWHPNQAILMKEGNEQKAGIWMNKVEIKV